MNHQWWGATLACLAVAFAPGAAYGAEPVRAVLDGPFHEAVNTEVSVSGTVVVGLGISGTAFRGSPAGMRVATTSPVVCLVVQSRDGVYFSRNQFSRPEGTVSAESLLLPYEGTRQLALLRGYQDGELVAYASPGPCSEPTEVLLVPQRAAPVEHIDIMVNGFGANATSVELGGAMHSCREITEGRRTAFDFRCSVAVADIPPDGKVTIHRERYGRPLPEAMITLGIR
jgi:hypothetical protein